MLAFREECLAIGRSTEPADRPKAEAAISKMYELMGWKQPRFWWSDGPAIGSIVRTLLKDKGANLGDNLGDNLRANLWDNLWANLGDNLGDNLWANLRANLGDNLDWGFWGQHELAWQAWTLWPQKELRSMHTADQMLKLELWWSISNSCGWWNPFTNIVFICERPERQAVDARGFLHHETGPALLCRDSWPVYALHGVRMKAEHVETPAECIAPETVLAETNADVRRELIRKVGVERMLSKLSHKVLDRKRGYRGESSIISTNPNEPVMYELLSVRLSDEVTDARFLKMINPSIGVFHVEGVAPECSTVQEANNWRTQKTDAPEILT